MRPWTHRILEDRGAVATIEQRAGNWSVRWRKGGRTGSNERRTYVSETFALRAKQIAEAAGHDITGAEVDRILGITSDDDETAKKKTGPTVKEWAVEWLKSRTQITPYTKKRYRRQLETVVLPAIGDKHLSEVTTADIVAILKALRRKGLKQTTIDRYHAVMSGLFAYAVDEKKLDESPVKRVGWVTGLREANDPAAAGDDHVYLTRAEFRMIRRHLPPAAVPVVDLLAGSGARWSEATAVPVRAVKLDAKPPAVEIFQSWKRRGDPEDEETVDDDAVEVVEVVVDEEGAPDQSGKWYLGVPKSGKGRTVAVSAELGRSLQPLTVDGDGNRRPGAALLLTAARGGRVDYSNFRFKVWEPAVDAAMRCDTHPPEVAADGGPALDGRGRWRRGAVSACDCEGRLKQRPSIHDLRHSHAAWLIAENRPIVSISRRLGHQTTEITELIYAGILPQVAEADAAALEGLLSDEAADGDAAG